MVHHLYTRITLLLLTALTLLQTAIHAQPYDDSDLRAVLLPESCAPPCFMGIQPGITTVDEVQRILRKSGWIQEIRMAPYARWMGVIWNEEAPVWFSNDAGDMGLLVAVENRTVQEVHFTTSLPLAQVQLLLGVPSRKYVTVYKSFGEGNYSLMLNYIAAYPMRRMVVASSQVCAVQKRIDLDTPDVVIHYFAAMNVQSGLLRAFQPSGGRASMMQC